MLGNTCLSCLQSDALGGLMGSRQLTSVIAVYILEWTCLIFPKGKLGTFYSFIVPYSFQGELYKLKVILLSAYGGRAV